MISTSDSRRRRRAASQPALCLITCAGALVCFAAWAVDLPAALPPHPRLLLGAQDIPAIQQRIAAQPWAKMHFDSLQRQADEWLKRKVVLPERGGQWYHWYSCPKHGARLRTEGPTRHVCPVDREVFRGQPYDDVVLMGEHNRLAGAIRMLGVVRQLTGNVRYAAKAKEILLAYAAQYTNYPLHTTRGEAKVGGGKVGPQTLDESTWLITLVEGADCLWDTLSADEQRKVTEGLLRPATDVIRQHKMGIHNIQCWKNSAVGLTGLLIGDLKLVDEAINGPSGYSNQMAKGASPDGAWYEGAWGYHFYTISALLHLTEGARHSGINLYGDATKRMFDAPLAMAMPDLELPAFNDSHPVSLPAQASLYETALARYGDDRYRLIVERGGRRSDAALLHGVADAGRPPGFAATSRNFPGSGYAILAAGQGTNATWLCLDYGPHGGGHGHPDKLGFVLYGLGQLLAPDPGTANYGVPIQAGWFRTTIAHNTLTVDEQSQKPAEGKCEAFIATNGFSAVMTSAGKIHDGVTFHRTVALLGEDLLVFIDQIRAEREHHWDLAYHNHGKLAYPGAPFERLSDQPGYAYLRDVRTVDSDAGQTLGFTLDGGRRVGWTMAPGAPTTYITGTGVGHHTEDRVPLVIARRKAKETVYVWCVGLDATGPAVELALADAKLADGRLASPADVASVQVKTARGPQLLVANPSGEPIRVAGVAVDGRIARLAPDVQGRLQVRDEASR
jgi:oligo-alginate lyase